MTVWLADWQGVRHTYMEIHRYIDNCGLAY